MAKELALVVDVETAGGFNNPLVYDLGLAVVVRATGEIIESRSLIVYDVFVGMKNEMQSAYYAEKIPTYDAGIKRGDHDLVRFFTAWGIVRELVAKYGISRVYAYNAGFDRGALDNTLRVVSGGRYRHFMPRSVRWCCIWHMACQTILSQKRYRRFATANNMVSAAGNIRTSAEAAYAYMTNQPHFIEAHTGLEDVKIEAAILAYVLRQKKRVSEKIARNPWRIPQSA
jgi:hypothetical protein